jgi:hypothetical protein
MPSSSLSSLIETLVNSIQTDTAALRERHVLREALQCLVRQAQVEQLARLRLEQSRLGMADRVWQEAGQQAGAYQRSAGIDHPIH